MNIYQLKNNLKKVKIARKIYNQAVNIYYEAKNVSFYKSQVKYFILISNGRSGSTCLLDLLESHPQISTDPHNFFNYTNLPTDFSQKKYTYSRKNILGFKFKSQPANFSQDDNNIIKAQRELQKLVDREVNIIYLRRKNILKRALSKLIAKNELKKRNYNSNFTKKEYDSLEFNSFKIDVEELRKVIQECEAQEHFNQQVISQLPCLKLIYEEDLLKEEDHQNTLDKICIFLGTEYAPVHTKYAKISPNKMMDYISNYEELKQEFQNTCYSKYLD